MRTKYLFAVIAIVVVFAIAAYALMHSPAAQAPVSATQQAQPTTSTYATTTFTVTYPRDFTATEFVNIEVNPAKPIAGVKITPPASTTMGNVAPDTFLSVEQLPHAKSCTGDIYLKENIQAQPFTDGSVSYSLATIATTTASGDTIEERVYAIADSKPCTAVRYYMHTSNANAASSTTPVNQNQLVSAFDAIRRSVTLTSAAPAPLPSATTSSSIPPVHAAATITTNNDAVTPATTTGASTPTASSSGTSVANPAAVSCAQAGGSVEIRNETGGQVGYCHLPDGKVCEEWALYRNKQCVAPVAQ